ncbi:MAG: HEAT repeat domain-containing protein, partial [bacterium]
LNSTIGDFAGAVRSLMAGYQRARELGAEFVVAPELFLCGYPPRDLLMRADFTRSNRKALELAAAQTGPVPLCVGFVDENPTRPGKPLHNSAAILQQGKIVQRFHKSLLPTYDVFDEARYFEPARSVGVFPLKGRTLAITICEDVWNDEDFWPERIYGRDPVKEFQKAALSSSDLETARQLALIELAAHAAVALENLTGHAEPAFNPFARTRQPERWRDWFHATNWDAIEAELVARLTNPDRAVVRRAAVTLGHTGAGEAARAALRQCLEKERENQAYAEWHQNHQGDNAQYNDLAPVNPRTAQAVARALGGMQDRAAVPLLAGILRQHANPATGNLFLAEAAAEALGQIGTPEARQELAGAFPGLASFIQFTTWYGDHGALMACHASPIHYFIIKALAVADAAPDAALLPALIRAVPVDFDRGLFFENDGYETVTGRLLRRNDPADTVAESCLALLGDPQAKATPAITAALAKTPRCWAGHATPEIRAAQILSLVCHDRASEPRIRAALLRYQAKPMTLPRVYSKGVPEVADLPLRHWACFFLARTLGNLADPQSVEPLAALLAESATEAATGCPDPTGNGVLFLHNDLTPCWRAAVAWALGRSGDRRAAPALLKIVRNLDNAPDTRCAAAEALERIADPASRDAIRELAATYPETATRTVLQRIASRSDVP